MTKRGMTTWQALLNGTADDNTVLRAYWVSIILAATGVALLTIAVTGLRAV